MNYNFDYNFDYNQNYFNNNIDYYSDDYNDDNYGLILNESPQGYNYNNALYPPPNYPNYSNYPIYPETFIIPNYDVPAITPINNMSKNNFAVSGTTSSTQMQQPIRQQLQSQIQQQIQMRPQVHPQMRPQMMPQVHPQMMPQVHPQVHPQIKSPHQIQKIPLSQMRTPAQKYSHYAGQVTSDRGDLANILFATGWDERPQDYNEPLQWLGSPQEYSESFKPPQILQRPRQLFQSPSQMPQLFQSPSQMPQLFQDSSQVSPLLSQTQQPNFILKILLIIILFILVAILVAVICKKNKQNKLKEHQGLYKNFF